MENIVIPWIKSSYKRNYIILIWGYMYLFQQFRMYPSFFQRFLYTMFNYFLRILLIFQIQFKFS